MNATNIRFLNSDGNVDETQFDTHDEHDLAELWWEFCKENDVISITKGRADYKTGILFENDVPAHYVIAVDYFTWDPDNDEEGREKVYLYTKGERKIYVFHETLDAEDDLKVFNSAKEAAEYIEAHNLKDSCCYENCRVEMVK